MTDERLFRRLEAKLDALLEKAGIAADKITGQLEVRREERKTAAEKDALANAPETPAAEHPSQGMAPSTTDPATNAPTTPATTYPAPDPATNAPATVPVTPEEAEKAAKEAEKASREAEKSGKEGQRQQQQQQQQQEQTPTPTPSREGQTQTEAQRVVQTRK